MSTGRSLQPPAKRGSTLMLQPHFFSCAHFVGALGADVDDLLMAFERAWSEDESEETGEMVQVMVRVWKARGWEGAHWLVLEPRAREAFLKAVCRLLLERTSPIRSATQRAGALIAIYIFYTSQPDDSYVLRLSHIPVELDTYRHLHYIATSLFPSTSTTALTLKHLLRTLPIHLHASASLVPRRFPHTSVSIPTPTVSKRAEVVAALREAEAKVLAVERALVLLEGGQPARELQVDPRGLSSTEREYLDAREALFRQAAEEDGGVEALRKALGIASQRVVEGIERVQALARRVVTAAREGEDNSTAFGMLHGSGAGEQDEYVPGLGEEQDDGQPATKRQRRGKHEQHEQALEQAQQEPQEGDIVPGQGIVSAELLQAAQNAIDAEGHLLGVFGEQQ